MAAESEELTSETWNYFNYYTEVEEHFQKVRGTALFLMSPLDWALVESWKNAGVPLEAVLRGIDQAFEKGRSKKQPYRAINSVAYCARAVQEEANSMRGSIAVSRSPVTAPFSIDELRSHLREKASAIGEKPQFEEVSAALAALRDGVEGYYGDLEELEQRLTALEDKMCAMVRARLSDEELFELRREFETSVRPYRSKMTTEQIGLLQRQYLDRRVQEKAELPRLSLFYMK